MTIRFVCDSCNRMLEAPDGSAKRTAICPGCSAPFVVPGQRENDQPIVDAEVVEEPETARTPWEIKLLETLQRPLQVVEFLDPPQSMPPKREAHHPPSDHQDLSSGPVQTISESPPEDSRMEPSYSRDTNGGQSSETRDSSEAETEKPVSSSDWLQWMLGAFLDPRSIQWLLWLGGGLMILGLVIWLISTGIFSQPLPLAVLFGVASLGTLAAGWVVTLRTKYKLAGRALTFVGCVVAPLNLWFYHSQELLMLDQGLWVAGVVCVGLYIATVLILRDALFLYAVEAGITLTSVLLLGSIGQATSASYLSLLLVSLGLISIHGYFAFPAKAEMFDRKRFGLPVFWSGHLQLLGGLVVLFATQLVGYMQPMVRFFELPEGTELLTNSPWVSGLIWLTAAYLYFGSDLLIRKIGVYIYAGAFSLVMAEITLLGIDWLGVEGIMTILALSACGVSLTTKFVKSSDHHYARVVAPLALILSIGPVLLGILLHFNSNFSIPAQIDWSYTITWKFVLASLVVAGANRVSAFLYQGISQSLSTVYIFFSAGALILAAAGGVQLVGLELLPQFMVLMLIPLGYLIAARLWRGQSPEHPVGWVAQAATIFLLGNLLVGTIKLAVSSGMTGIEHLHVSIILLEAALFYGLASVFGHTRRYGYFCAAALCGAMWQMLIFLNFPQALLATLIAFIGLGLIVASRVMGIGLMTVYGEDGTERQVNRGRGYSISWIGHGSLSTALIIALLSGLANVAAVEMGERELVLIDWLNLGLVTLASAIAIGVSPRGPWPRVYGVGTIGMFALVFLTINVASDLSPMRKLEIFLVVVGCLILSASYVARFREAAGEPPQSAVTLGLWWGSLLITLPIFATVMHHWATQGGFATYDEFALITFCVLLLATGLVWQVKASTILGGGTLFVYLTVLSISLIHRPQVTIGIYLAIGGGVLFAIGLLLAVCRDRLSKLPESIAKREGVFKVISWR